MKKSIIILGMLGFSLTYAQQDNNGKVGVNTETPSATLNVKSKTGKTNATKNLELENANGTKLVTVLDGGRVGIYKENPEERLDVNGTTQSLSFRAKDASDVGPWIEFNNTLKTDAELVDKWRIYNMKSGGTYDYVDGLHFWAYRADRTNSSQVVLKDNGSLGIGFPSRASSSKQQDNKLEVNGTARVVSLAGKGDRPVYADENGVLKVSTEDHTDEKSKWTNDNQNRVVKLTNLSDGKTAREDGKNVFVNNNGFFGIRTKPISAITIEGDGGASDDINIYSYSGNNASGALSFRRYRGTTDNKETVQVGDYLGNITFRGYNGKQEAIYSSIASIVSEVSETGTKSNLLLNPTNNGNVGIGNDNFIPTAKFDVQGVSQTREGFRATSVSDGGPWIEFNNTSKTEAELVDKWRIYNMKSGGSYDYVNGLHFWAYRADGTNLSSQMVIRDDGNVGIGFVSRVSISNQTNEKLEVNGNVKANNGIFTKLPVYADDAAADADTNLPSGSLYKLKNTGRQVFVKP